MQKIKDLTGERFGKVIALEFERCKGWKCLCDCGKTFFTNGYYLRHGRVKSCGCSHYEHTKRIVHPRRGNTISHNEIVGKVYGHLTVIKSAGFFNNHEHFLCKCVCGREKVIDYYKLVSGHTSSCGSNIHKIKNDLSGMKFGRLTVIRPLSIKGSDGAMWECICECGNTCIKNGHDLFTGTKSCGCLKNERNERTESKVRLYKTWCNMKTRCLNKNNKNFKNYGGRGIKICQEWLEYPNFKKWALENGYDDKLTIERINVNGDYCPENCKFASYQEQANNKRKTLFYTYKGQSVTLSELSSITKLSYDNLHHHYHNNTLGSWLKGKGF